MDDPTPSKPPTEHRGRGIDIFEFTPPTRSPSYIFTPRSQPDFDIIENQLGNPAYNPQPVAFSSPCPSKTHGKV
jgi:hypothetical protein